MGFETRKRDNQSNEHRKLVQSAILWFGNRVSLKGMRGTTEWGPSRPPTYAADFMAMGSFQYTHAIRYESPPPHYDPKVMVFEAKATRADFANMFGSTGSARTQAPLGHLHWIVCPAKLVTLDEVPAFWGLLERRGAGLSERKRPQLQTMSQERLDAIGHDMLWVRRSWLRYYECDRLNRIVRFMRRGHPPRKIPL